MVVEVLGEGVDVDSIRVRLKVKKYSNRMWFIYFTSRWACLSSSRSIIRAGCFWVRNRIGINVGSFHSLSYCSRFMSISSTVGGAERLAKA